MKAITLHWEVTETHSAVVWVPEDFDVDNFDVAQVEEAVATLEQQTYDYTEETKGFRAYEGAQYPQDIEHLF